MTFDRLDYDGAATAETEGFTLTVSCEHDSDANAPWDDSDGHGPVSAWERRDKAPGELVLCEDSPRRGNGAKRFYDFAEACRIARRDGWGMRQPGETFAQKAARAAREDYESLRAWCADQWDYCGVIVTASKDGIKLGSASLWGIERDYPGDDGSYRLEVANDLAGEAIADARAKLETLCDCTD